MERRDLNRIVENKFTDLKKNQRNLSVGIIESKTHIYKNQRDGNFEQVCERDKNNLIL